VHKARAWARADTRFALLRGVNYSSGETEFQRVRELWKRGEIMVEWSGPEDTRLEDTPVQLERRELERLACRHSPFVRVLARPSFQMYRAFLQDISPQGLGLVLDRSFEVGTLLAIQLRTVHAGVSGILTARVIHATPQADGSWLLGCSLNCRLTDEEMFHLL
jgi:hypothetical protein